MDQQAPTTPRPPDDSLAGPSRRTVLASERTWLAWFRTGIAVSAAAIAVGGVIPHLIEGSRTPYVVLGIGYALLAAAVFVYGWIRHRQISRALEQNRDVPPGIGWMFGLTAFGAVLAIATLALVVIDP